MIKTQNPIFRILFIAAISMVLSNCGFKPRSSDDISPNLHTMYLDTNEVSEQITADTARMLTALGVKLVQTESEAPVTLSLSKSKINTEMPVVLYSGISTTYTYTLSLDISLSTHNHQSIIKDHTITTSRSLTYNTNQTGTPIFSPVIRRELNRNMVNLIYYNLSNKPTKNALSKALPPSKKQA
jgi:outer membrane lipopolysaccharide assembly protein LptE/RlpB